MNENKKISIVMATYNGESYISEQLESLCAQIYQNFILIVTDDNSSDNTVPIIEKFKNRLDIRLFKNKKNLGYVKNFEKALGLVDTEYIAMCDQDDIWHENKLSLLLENIKDNTLIYSNSHIVDEQGNSLGLSLEAKLKTKFISTKSVLPFIFHNCVSAHASLFKKELLSHISPFPELIPFDAWIGLNAAALNGIHYLNEELVDYRQHEDSVMQQLRVKKVRLKKMARREKMHKKISKTINEILTSKLLNNDEQKLLEEIKNGHDKFDNSWFNLRLFFLHNKHKEKFYAMNSKNILDILKKFIFGKYIYKYILRT